MTDKMKAAILTAADAVYTLGDLVTDSAECSDEWKTLAVQYKALYHAMMTMQMPLWDDARRADHISSCECAGNP